jgi:hypothetical protein
MRLPTTALSVQSWPLNGQTHLSCGFPSASLLSNTWYKQTDTAHHSAAEARLEFMITYRNAHQYSSIDGHIKAARGLIDSAKESIHEARLNYESKFTRLDLLTANLHRLLV